MNKLIYTYALIRSLYDQGDDYIDSFWPFAIQVLEEKEYIDTPSIQFKIVEKCGFTIPLHVLGIILKRARRKEYLDYKYESSEGQKKECYRLTPKGARYLKELEAQEDVEERIAILISDIPSYYREKGVDINDGQVLDLLTSVFQENQQSLEEFINPSKVFEQDSTIPKEDIHILIDYFKCVEQTKPDKYRTIQDIYFGSIISTIISAGDQRSIQEFASRKLKNCSIYMDSNFLLSLLELRPSGEIVEGAKELFQLIKNYGLRTRIFDFTVDEVTRVLSFYFSDEYRYSKSIIVDDVCSCLKQKGFTKTELREYISNIETTLHGMGIDIEIRRNINVRTFQPSIPELRSRMEIYKKDQNIYSQNHDLAAIDCIREIRKHSSRQIELTNSLFLTSDANLSRFNLIEYGHRSAQTVSEVILDRLLTNILWLKIPHAKPTLKSIIASHSRNLFVKSRVWAKFYDIVSDLKEKDEIDDQNISMLFYHGYIEDSLRHFEDTEAETITKEYVLEEIDKATKLYQEELDIKLGEKEKEFLKLLKETTKKKVQNATRLKEKEWLANITSMKQNIRASSTKTARLRISILKAFLSAIFVIPFFVLLILNWTHYGQVADLITIGLFIIGITGWSIKGAWKKLEQNWTTAIYLKRIKDIGLDELQD